jgi:hypothetical protein
MRIYEIASKKTLQVKRDAADAVTLEDPETGIETVVPKDPTKPGKIEKNEQGEFVLSTADNGDVDDEALRPGETVKVEK